MLGEGNKWRMKLIVCPLGRCQRGGVGSGGGIKKGGFAAGWVVKAEQ